MRSAFTLLVIPILLLGLDSPARSQEARVERVEFAPGSSQASIAGRIQGYETVHYMVDARAGQTIDITLDTAHTATYFNFLPAGHHPGRDAAVFTGEVEGAHYRGALPTDGPALIEVYMMRSAARRNEVARYTLTVAVEGEPKAGGAAAHAGPWPVDTDASGELPCAVGGTSLERSAFDRSCPFRVKRNAYGATIWVVGPGEEGDPSALAFEDLRTIYFEGRQPGLEGGVEMNDAFSTGDGAEVRWDRVEDNWIVNVGGERYWVPDAVIWGG